MSSLYDIHTSHTPASQSCPAHLLRLPRFGSSSMMALFLFTGSTPARMMPGTECAHSPHSSKRSRRRFGRQTGHGDATEIGRFRQRVRGIRRRESLHRRNSWKARQRRECCCVVYYIVKFSSVNAKSTMFRYARSPLAGDCL